MVLQGPGTVAGARIFMKESSRGVRRTLLLSHHCQQELHHIKREDTNKLEITIKNKRKEKHINGTVFISADKMMRLVSVMLLRSTSTGTASQKTKTQQKKRWKR